MRLWVLIRRYEWEEQAQQTEYCDTFVFRRWDEAVRKAASLLRRDVEKYGNGMLPADVRIEEKAMLADFRTEFPRHIVQLSDYDTIVYELYRKEIKAVSYVKSRIDEDLHEKCLTVGDLRRALARLPDDCLVNTVDGSTILGECVHVRHDRGSDYADVGVVANDRTR